MSLYTSFASNRHFDELDSPLVTAEGVKTPAQRRALALANLFVAGDSNAIAGTFTSLTMTTATIGTQITTTGVGAIPAVSTIVAVEGGDQYWHRTTLVMTAFSLGNVGDLANLAIGNKIYTFPAGSFQVKDMVVAGLFSAAVDDTSQTPEYGVGSTIGTGAVATLSTTMEDYIDGGAAGGMVGGTAVIPDLLGTTEVAKAALETIDGGNWIKTSGGLSHDLFLNAADAWDDVTTVAPLLFTGRVSFAWRKLT